MVIYAAIPSLIVGLVLLWTGRRRLAYLVGFSLFITLLVVFIVFSQPLTEREWLFTEP